MKWVKWIGYGFFCAFCLAIGAGTRLFFNIAESVGGKGSNPIKVWGTIVAPEKSYEGPRQFTVLLVGKDYNRDRIGMPYTKNSRADTIMMLAVDVDKQSIRACSIPRDTYIQAADQLSGKINATLVRGGVDLLKRTLEQQFGITINHYVLIKPSAVKEIVNSVGGVEVEAIDDMKYDDNWGQLHVNLTAGRHHLNGEQAEGFVRFRKMNSGEGRSKEEGDLRRTARQQQMIRALMQAANNPSNFLRLDEIIDTGFGQIETDLPRMNMVALASIFRSANLAQMPSATVPGTDGMMGAESVFEMDRERAQSMVDWLIKGDDLAMKRLVRVEIRNGTKTPGVARLAADMLDSQGYSASAPGNAPSTPVTTIVYRKASFEEAAREIQKVLGASNITKEAKPANDWDPEIRIVIGSDIAEKMKSQAGPT